VYGFCQALETLESDLLGGFYFQHFLLARTVLGTGAKGTMGRAVEALARAHNGHIFPELDVVRTACGDIFDKDLTLKKAEVLERVVAGSLRTTSDVSATLEEYLLRKRDVLVALASPSPTSPEGVGEFPVPIQKELEQENQSGPEHSNGDISKCPFMNK